MAALPFIKTNSSLRPARRAHACNRDATACMPPPCVQRKLGETCCNMLKINITVCARGKWHGYRKCGEHVQHLPTVCYMHGRGPTANVRNRKKSICGRRSFICGRPTQINECMGNTARPGIIWRWQEELPARAILVFEMII